ncbi:hypothetical protein MRX96_006915 [Rhipicephalus microplus]
MNDYVIIEKTGEGAYGAVYKAKYKATKKIVAIKKSWVEDGDEGIPAVHLVFEYMTMDLRALLCSHAKNRTFDDAVVKKYLGQIVTAILFCHQRRVLHHDLKSANVLVDGNGTLKVGDFGLSRAFTPPVRVFTDKLGTFWYHAPETLLGASRYSRPVGVWSFGCIFFELLTGKFLFLRDSEIDQLFRIFRVLDATTHPYLTGSRDCKRTAHSTDKEGQ